MADDPETPAEPAAVGTAATDAGPRVSYAEYGDPDGRPVLFLHGTPGSRVLGELFDEEARRAGVRLLAPDRPGYGDSPPWPSRTLAEAARFAGPVLDDAGVATAGVVGFSGGGPHALALAATRGDRVERVDAIACAPPPDADRRRPPGQRLLAALADAAPRLLRGVLRVQAWGLARLPPRFVAAQYTSDPGALPAATVECVRRDFVTALSRSRRGAVTEFAALDRDWGVALETVDVPVGLWHGADDANAPVAGARRLCDRLPNADLTVLDDADHLTALLRCRSAVLARHADD
jgi:pimeloyl-ACP methyl ester carboxylesterase